MKVFARAELVPANLASDEPALLCEGSWPSGEQSVCRWSLDEAIDARCAWIDREAARLAEQAACAIGESTGSIFAWLNALPLRYELVKLIRVVAFFEQCYRPHRREALELHFERQRDEAYALLFREVCRSHRLPRVERWQARRQVNTTTFPANRRWRRAVAHVAQTPEAKLIPTELAVPRVVLCGNPRILDPVCEELLRSGARVWWLYDRFAVRSFARWRVRGVRQLICEADLGRANCFAELRLHARLACRGIDLGGAVECWLTDRARTHGARQTRLLAEAERQLRAVQPDAIVCDEDATPLPRVALHVTRPFGTQGYVVQHGAPCIRFGFTPPAADQLLVWGASSQRQLERWGVHRERIIITGAPFRNLETLDPPAPRSGRSTAGEAASDQNRPSSESDAHDFSARSNSRRHIVLLATVPPDDTRPDAVEYHLTRSTHAAMLDAACAAIARVPGATLTIKIHPRTRDETDFRQALARHPSLDARIVRGGQLARLVRGAACVLSCASSAGVEAAAWGKPVIQLLPAGSVDILPTVEWGFLGTARSESELTLLLSVVLDGAQQHPSSPVFAANGRTAARRVVEAVLAPLPLRNLIDEPARQAAALTPVGASPWPSN